MQITQPNIVYRSATRLIISLVTIPHGCAFPIAQSIQITILIIILESALKLAQLGCLQTLLLRCVCLLSTVLMCLLDSLSLGDASPPVPSKFLLFLTRLSTSVGRSVLLVSLLTTLRCTVYLSALQILISMLSITQQKVVYVFSSVQFPQLLTIDTT